MITSVDLTEISPRRDENFPYEQTSQLTRMGFVICTCAVNLFLLLKFVKFVKTLEMIDSCFRSRDVNKLSSRLGGMKKFTI